MLSLDQYALRLIRCIGRIRLTFPSEETVFMTDTSLKAGLAKLLGDPELALGCAVILQEDFRGRGDFERRGCPGLAGMLETLGRAGRAL